VIPRYCYPDEDTVPVPFTTPLCRLALGDGGMDEALFTWVSSSPIR